VERTGPRTTTNTTTCPTRSSVCHCLPTEYFPPPVSETASSHYCDGLCKSDTRRPDLHSHRFPARAELIFKVSHHPVQTHSFNDSSAKTDYQRTNFVSRPIACGNSPALIYTLLPILPGIALVELSIGFDSAKACNGECVVASAEAISGRQRQRWILLLHLCPLHCKSPVSDPLGSGHW